MKTPCQTNNPDLWTSDHAADRRRAADLCQGCHRITACFIEAERNREKHGVFGARDFSKSDALTGARAASHNATAELVTEVDDLLADGFSTYDVLRILNTTPAALARRLYRAGRPDIAKRFGVLQGKPKGSCPECGGETSERGRRCVPCGHSARQPKWRESFQATIQAKRAS